MKSRGTHAVLIILLLAIIGAGVTACGTTTSPLAGKWHHSEGLSYIEFFSNGKFEIGSDMDTITGNYEVTGDNRVTLTVDSEGSEAADEEYKITFEYRISGNELILDDGVIPVSFRRAD